MSSLPTSIRFTTRTRRAGSAFSRSAKLTAQDRA